MVKMELKINAFQKHKRLSVVQFTALPANTFDYISGPKAVKDDLIQIKEVSQAGSVNSLSVFNISDKFVFFMDGDILSGAKQNRVLNTSVFIAPNSKFTLPVSCVEQGRWSAISDKFSTSDYVTPQKLRARKARAVDESLSAERGFMAEQREVWNDVQSYATYYKVVSPTMSLTDVFENKKGDFDSFIKNFPADPDSNGLAVFTDRDLLNIDLFNRTDIYREYFPRILRSTAMEIASLKEKANEITEAEAKFKTADMFDNLEKMEHTKHPGAGVGEEKRYDKDNLTGFELSYKTHLIHMTILNLGETNNDERRNRVH
jgi:hypothetical protein